MVVAFAISFAAIELAWRMMGHEPRRIVANPHFRDSWSQPDGALGWINRPGTHRSIEPGEVEMSFTQDGARVSGPPGSKADAARRILLVGGSFMQGYGIEDHETAAWLLNERNPGLWVDNFGTGGYGTYQASLMLTRQIQQGDLPTALVVYGFMTGHPERNVAPSSWVRVLTDSSGRYFAPPHVALTPEGTVGRSGGAIPVWPFETRSAIVASIHDRWLDYTFPHPPAEERRKATADILKKMDATARENGAGFLLANLDRSEPWLQEFAERNAIPYADCSSEDMPDPANRVGGTGHPNAIIHARWADCIQSAVVEILNLTAANNTSP